MRRRTAASDSESNSQSEEDVLSDSESEHEHQPDEVANATEATNPAPLLPNESSHSAPTSPEEKKTEDPTVVPTSGRFWMHDDRGASSPPAVRPREGEEGRAKRGRGRGRGGRNRRKEPQEPSTKEPEGAKQPRGKQGKRELWEKQDKPEDEPTWEHDKFHELMEEAAKDDVNKKRRNRGNRKNGRYKSRSAGEQNISTTSDNPAEASNGTAPNNNQPEQNAHPTNYRNKKKMEYRRKDRLDNAEGTVPTPQNTQTHNTSAQTSQPQQASQPSRSKGSMRYSARQQEQELQNQSTSNQVQQSQAQPPHTQQPHHNQSDYQEKNRKPKAKRNKQRSEKQPNASQNAQKKHEESGDGNTKNIGGGKRYSTQRAQLVGDTNLNSPGIHPASAGSVASASTYYYNPFAPAYVPPGAVAVPAQGGAPYVGQMLNPSFQPVQVPLAAPAAPTGGYPHVYNPYTASVPLTYSPVPQPIPRVVRGIEDAEQDVGTQFQAQSALSVNAVPFVPPSLVSSSPPSASFYPMYPQTEWIGVPYPPAEPVHANGPVYYPLPDSQKSTVTPLKPREKTPLAIRKPEKKTDEDPNSPKPSDLKPTTPEFVPKTSPPENQSTNAKVQLKQDAKEFVPGLSGSDQEIPQRNPKKGKNGKTGKPHEETEKEADQNDEEDLQDRRHSTTKQQKQWVMKKSSPSTNNNANTTAPAPVTNNTGASSPTITNTSAGATLSSPGSSSASS